MNQRNRKIERNIDSYNDKNSTIENDKRMRLKREKRKTATRDIRWMGKITQLDQKCYQVEITRILCILFADKMECRTYLGALAICSCNNTLHPSEHRCYRHFPEWYGMMHTLGMGCYISKINILHELRSKHKYTLWTSNDIKLQCALLRHFSYRVCAECSPPLSSNFSILFSLHISLSLLCMLFRSINAYRTSAIISQTWRNFRNTHKLERSGGVARATVTAKIFYKAKIAKTIKKF